MIKPSIDSIEELLAAGLMDRSEAQRRAPLVFEDLNWIDFDSLMLDARILAKTVMQVLRPRGVSREGHATMPEFMGGKER